MSNIGNYAKKELEILFERVPDSVLVDFKDEIITLCDKFGNSGQSGASAPFVASALSNAIKKLCMFQTLTPITGEDNEWGEWNSYGGGVEFCQNLRDSRIFKDKKDNRAYFIDAIIKRCPDGTTWNGWFWKSKEDYLTGNKDLKVSPRGYIKSFPFTPKTFYIDVIEEEVAPDDWETYMKDSKQLEEISEYYDLK